MSRSQPIVFLLTSFLISAFSFFVNKPRSRSVSEKKFVPSAVSLPQSVHRSQPTAIRPPQSAYRNPPSAISLPTAMRLSSFLAHHTSALLRTPPLLQHTSVHHLRRCEVSTKFGVSFWRMKAQKGRKTWRRSIPVLSICRKLFKTRKTAGWLRNPGWTEERIRMPSLHRSNSASLHQAAFPLHHTMYVFLTYLCITF